MTFSPHGAVTSANYSPDETRIVTSGGDASAKVWDVSRGTALFKFALAHEGVINSAVYSPDGQSILTASDDGTARLWNAATGELMQTFAVDSTADTPVASARPPFRSTGKYVVTASNDRTVRVCTARAARSCSRSKVTQHAVACAAFSRDGKRIVSGSEDNTARVWDACHGRAGWRTRRTHGRGDVRLLFARRAAHPDG